MLESTQAIGGSSTWYWSASASICGSAEVSAHKTIEELDGLSTRATSPLAFTVMVGGNSHNATEALWIYDVRHDIRQHWHPSTGFEGL